MPEHPTTGSPPEIAVVILNWNGAAETLACLRTLLPEAPDELLVLDNGSEDDSVARIRAELPDVPLLENGANLGFAEGVNRGIDATRAPWVLLLNNDTEVRPGCLEFLRAAVRDAPADVGMMQPLLLFHHEPERINSSGVVLEATGLAFDRHFRAPLADLVPTEPFAVTAGAGLYRRSMLEALKLPTGYFDRTHFMYFEDVDLGWRARLGGWKAQLVAEARVLHHFQGSSKRQVSHFVQRWCKLNRVRMLLKNASGPRVRDFFFGKRFTREARWLFKRDGLGGLWALLKAVVDGGRARRRVGRMAVLDRAELEARWLDRT